MSYPAIAQSYDSKENRLTGRQLDRASNGTLHVRSFFTSQKKTFNIIHQLVTDDDKATIEAFYAANALNSFTFVWLADGASYTCMFSEEDPVYEPAALGLWNITTSLVQV